MLLTELQQLGLSKKEAAIYLALLDLGQVSAGEIITKTRYHREIVYTALKRLEEKELASFVRKKGKRFYQAANPERILKNAEENYKMAKEILPKLQTIEKKAKHGQFIQIYEGKEGVRQIREHMLKAVPIGGEICILGASAGYFQNMGDYSNIWHAKRAKRKIVYKVQLYKTIEQKTKEAFKNFEFVEIKTLAEKYEMPASTAIFADSVVLQIWGDEPVMILIQNENLTKSYRDTFNILWKIAK